MVLAAVFSLPLSSFSLEYSIRPSILLQQSYNDNIELSSNNRIGDFVTSVTPGLNLEARAEKLQIVLNYNPSIQRYWSHSEFNYVSHSASAKLNYAPSEQWKFALGHAFVQTEDSGTIRALEGAGPVTVARNKVTNNTTMGNVEFKASTLLSFTLDGVYSTTENNATSLSDVTFTAVGLGVQYRLSERTSLLARTRQTFYEYQTTGNSRSGDYLIGVLYRLTPTLTAEVLGGVVVTQTDVPERTNTGFSGDLILRKTLEKGTASLTYHQSVIAGTESNEPIDSKQLTLQYSMPLSPLWDVRASAGYGIFKSLHENTEDTRVITALAELSYRLSARASVILSYTFADSKDKINRLNSYHNNVILLGLRLSTEGRF